MTGFVGFAGGRIAGLTCDPWFSGALVGVFASRTGQAARISTSARFMFIAIATNCRWQALRARPR